MSHSDADSAVAPSQPASQEQVDGYSPSSLFDEYYYAHGCGHPYERSDDWLAAFERMANRIVRDIRPNSVLDAGCAMGFLVEKLRSHQVDAFGIDVSTYAIEQVHKSVQPFCQVGSITDPFPQRYDLIVCIEVLEHMDGADAEQAVANFCQFTDDVLFSSTPYDYKEATHFFVQPPEYWAELFGHHGFFRDVDFDASFITPWAVRFRRRTEPTARIIRDYERRHWLLQKENQDLRALALEMRESLAASAETESAIESVDELPNLRNEVERLSDLVQRYENGRFMRFMRWLHQLNR